jgi:hypothetical protein
LRGNQKITSMAGRKPARKRVRIGDNRKSQRWLRQGTKAAVS